jgi:hypothetical protein
MLSIGLCCAVLRHRGHFLFAAYIKIYGRAHEIIILIKEDGLE